MRKKTEKGWKKECGPVLRQSTSFLHAEEKVFRSNRRIRHPRRIRWAKVC